MALHGRRHLMGHLRRAEVTGIALLTDAFKAVIRDYHGLDLSDADDGRGRPELSRVGIKAHSATAGIHTTVGSKVPAEYVPEADTH